MIFDIFGLASFERQIRAMNIALNHLTEKVRTMTAELDHLKASEAALVAKVDEAIALLHTLKIKIDELIAAGNDSPDLQALADQADAALAKLTDEVTADTPAA